MSLVLEIVDKVLCLCFGYFGVGLGVDTTALCQSFIDIEHKQKMYRVKDRVTYEYIRTYDHMLIYRFRPA